MTIYHGLRIATSLSTLKGQIPSLHPSAVRLRLRVSSTMSTLLQKQQKFLSSPQFAVVGASKDQTKYGTKVLKWYQAQNKTVTPIHPKEESLEGLNTLKSISDLPLPTTTSISIITPPPISLKIIKEAKELGIPALWLQPGAEDEEVKRYVEEAGLGDSVILGGPCILVDGVSVIRSLL